MESRLSSLSNANKLWLIGLIDGAPSINIDEIQH